MSEEPTFWSQRDAAREYTRVAAVCEALFETLGGIAPRLEPASAVVAAAPVARRFGAHATAWRDLVPESVLLADDRAAAPPRPSIEPSLDAVVAVVGSLRSDLADLLTRTSDVADRSARRQATSTLGDLDLALDEFGSIRTTAIG